MIFLWFCVIFYKPKRISRPICVTYAFCERKRKLLYLLQVFIRMLHLAGIAVHHINHIFLIKLPSVFQPARF